ncbi:MAG: flagellar hook-length control protein FliK, partial [Chthoniobacterales bacterium]|nr:flagellar hook-length control protein FliK [Chthoniobacterales bacterium]
AEVVDDFGSATAEGEVDILAALGLEDATDAADDLSALRANAAVATPTAEKSTNSKPQSQPTVVDEALAADAPADTETENAVKPIQANLKTQSGDADPQFDLAQQSANQIDAKTTSVTTVPPTAEVTVAPAPVATATSHTAPLPATPQAQITVPDFAETNHDKIVTILRSSAFDKGGTMEIRLDPPELGALQVSVKMQDGVMTASFQTSNDEATRLLSHSLGQLKHVLESAGVTVDKLQVQQSPKNDNDTAGDGRHHSERDDSSARQEQQRKEMIKRMWRKLSGVSDPLDLVA